LCLIEEEIQGQVICEKRKQREHNGVRRRTRFRAKRILHARAGGTSSDK